MKQLIIVANAPSPNTKKLVEAALAGAQHEDITGVESRWIPPLEATPEDVLNADGILLGTTENLAYMSGALKDFFDRCYYPVLEEKQGMPCAVYIRAGLDGTGTQRALSSILTGLRWNLVQDIHICHGEWTEDFIDEVRTLAMTLAAGMDAGIY